MPRTFNEAVDAITNRSTAADPDLVEFAKAARDHFEAAYAKDF